MATVQSYTKTGVDRKFQARSPVTLAYAGTGTPELAAFPDAKSGDVIEREGDRARWRVVGNQLTALPGSVTSVNGNSGIVTLSAQDVGAASSSHTHTKSQITDLEAISTGDTANHIVKRTSAGQVEVPLTPTIDRHAVSKKYVDDAVGDAAVGDHRHDIADIDLLQDELDKKAEKTYVDDQISNLAGSSHTHTKSQITDLEAISTGDTANHIVKRTNTGGINVPTTPDASSSATSKSYVDKEINTRAPSSHTHTKAQITDLETISTVATVNHLVKRTTSGNIVVPTTPNSETSAASKNYVDNQVNTRAASNHTHTKSDITDLEIVSTDVTLNHIVKRTTSGNISVPAIPNANASATSKSYVDSQISTRAASSHTHTKSQITDLETISTGVRANFIVKRGDEGNIYVPTTPATSGSAASKNYVDIHTPWAGTRTQYNALTNKSSDRLYIITGA